MRYFKHKNSGEVYAGTEAPSGISGLVEINEEEARAEAEKKTQKAFSELPYDQKRKREYPPIEDYIDAIVKGDDAQLQNYIDACIAVKAKYPKTEDK